MKNNEKRDFDFVRGVWIVSMAFFGLKEILQLVNDPYMVGCSDIFFGSLGAIAGCVMFSIAWQNRKNSDFKNTEAIE